MVKRTDICISCGRYLPEGEGMICKMCQTKSEEVCLAFKKIHIENSYNIWSTSIMWGKITAESWCKYQDMQADRVLNRSYRGMYIKWYLHNIGYWITLPFAKNTTMKSINEKYKHIDFEEHYR